MGDLILNVEHIFHAPVVSLRPEVVPVCHLDQLCGDPQPITRRPDAALQYCPDLEFRSHLGDVRSYTFKRKRRRPGRNVEILEVHEGVDDLLRHAVAEVLVIRIWAQVCKRQYGNRFEIWFYLLGYCA